MKVNIEEEFCYLGLVLDVYSQSKSTWLGILKICSNCSKAKHQM